MTHVQYRAADSGIVVATFVEEYVNVYSRSVVSS